MTLFDPDSYSPSDRRTTPPTGEDDGSAGPQSQAPALPNGERRVVYTDGACSGNPGPGGWGWVSPDEMWASGAEDPSTNQRMEVQAVLHAIGAIEGPLQIVSDSTYVVNCFRDEWWVGWERRGWRNSQKKDVANQDLWKPLIALYKQRDVTFRWVKGHAGDRWNDEADRLAVEAIATGGSNGVVRTTE
ncbi:MAG: ribonuclease H family protein [Acidimicrobiales bacterium]